MSTCVTVLALENLFFLFNNWSLGLNIPSAYLIIVALILSPFIGRLWIAVMAKIFYFTGHKLRGRAPLSHLRVAVAWAKVPAIPILLSWISIIFIEPKEAFIQLGSGNPVTMIFHFVNFIFFIFSISLTIRSIRAVENFSYLRSIVNVLYPS